MLIVLTSEKEIINEAMLLNQLFDNGLEVLHLRKPSFDIDGYRKLLDEIDVKHLSRIMIHQYHELSTEFGLRGIHIQEQSRLDLGKKLKDYVRLWKFGRETFKRTTNNQQPTTNNYYVSSSFHEPEELADCEIEFDYHLLSPVFSSISKVGYEGRGFDVNAIDKTIVGMGGVNTETIPKVLKLGYKGIGVLGGVWNAENPLESFKNIKEQFDGLVS